MSAITIQNLTKRYGPVLAVDDLSFDVRPGQVTGFLGPNGSGKTTTLRILLGLAKPTAGTAVIGGLAYHQLPDPVRQVGATLDSNSFHPGRSAAQHRARVFAVKVAVIAGLGAVFSALVFGLGLGTVVLTLSVHGIHHLPAGIGQLYLGTVISSACFGMIGVALGALTRNTIGAIVAAIAWTLFVEQVVLAAIVPGIEKWLPTGAAIDLTNAPGPGPAHSLSPAAAGLALAGYAIILLLAASRTTIRGDVG